VEQKKIARGIWIRKRLDTITIISHHWDGGAALPFLFSPVEKSVTETSIQNETNEGDGR
jgi:hypothetical protein